MTSIVASSGDPIVVIVETGSSLTLNRNANINKIVTLYPKKKLDTYLSKISKNKINKKNEPRKAPFANLGSHLYYI